MFYEITYETGRVSVAEYATEDEAKSALAEQHRRATNGEPGGPVATHPAGLAGEPNWAAERIAKVRVYDKHPNEYNPDQTMSAEVLKKALDDMIDSGKDENGVVALDQFVLAVRGLSHPMQGREHSFDSVFRMEEKKELNLAFLGGVK